jgi:hypothetical protein
MAGRIRRNVEETRGQHSAYRHLQFLAGTVRGRQPRFSASGCELIADGATPTPQTAPSSRSRFIIFMSGNAGVVVGANLCCGFTMNL